MRGGGAHCGLRRVKPRSMYRIWSLPASAAVSIGTASAMITAATAAGVRGACDQAGIGQPSRARQHVTVRLARIETLMPYSVGWNDSRAAAKAAVAAPKTIRPRGRFAAVWGSDIMKNTNTRTSGDRQM